MHRGLLRRCFSRTCCTPALLPRPVRAAMSRITWAESTPRSRTPSSSVRSQRSHCHHCPKRYWVAPEEPCTRYQSQCSVTPGLNTPAFTSIKATCFNPASCGDSDVATSQCCQVPDQLNAGSLSTAQKSQAASRRTLHAATPGQLRSPLPPRRARCAHDRDVQCNRIVFVAPNDLT